MSFTPWKARSAAVASGLLLAAAFPPLNWWPLALIALVPLLLAVWCRSCRSKAFQALPIQPDAVGIAEGMGTQGLEGLATDSLKAIPQREAGAPGFWPGFRLGWIFGFVFFTATLWWIQHVTLPGMLALCAYLALYPAVAMGIAGWLGVGRGDSSAVMSAKLLLVACAWAGLEWFRGVALSGFPWNGLAVPLFDSPALRSLSSFAGVTGLSAAVVFYNGSLVLPGLAPGRVMVGHACRLLVVFGGLFVILSAVNRWFGVQPLQGGPHQDELTAILIQPNVTMEEKMSPDPELQRERYFDLVAQTDVALVAADGSEGHPKPDLVVWPESAVPGFFDEMVQGGAFADLLKLGEFSLVTGSDDREWDKLYNSIAVMRGTTENRALQPKVRLVPFGEFIPFRKQVPLFEKMLGNLIPMDFNAGTSLEPMRVKDQPFSIVPLVCFEDTIGDHARKFIRPEPQVLVNVTNDNWFHESPATEMHFANARWRAVELHRALIRSANTGVTAIVSPWGEVERLPSHKEGTLTGKFDTGTGNLTFYAEHGEVFSQVAGGFALLGCGMLWLSRRRRFCPAVLTAKDG